MIDVRKKNEGEDWIDRDSLVGRFALRNILKIPSLQMVGRIKSVSKSYVNCEALDGSSSRVSLKHLEGVCDTLEEYERLKNHGRKWLNAQNSLYDDARNELEALGNPDPEATMKF